MKYLSIYEAPCVGTVAETFEAENAVEATIRAWEKSFGTKEYVPGGYELYQITYNPKTHHYELIPAEETLLGDGEDVQ